MSCTACCNVYVLARQLLGDGVLSLIYSVLSQAPASLLATCEDMPSEGRSRIKKYGPEDTRASKGVQIWPG